VAGPVKRVGVVARRQHGVVSRAQAHEAGLSDRAIRGWVTGGRLERVHAGVYRVGGAPTSWEQVAMAAVLAAGGVASHRTAGQLWGLCDAHDRVEVTVPRGRRGGASGVVVHRSRDLAERHVTRRAGMPVTTPMRTWWTWARSWTTGRWPTRLSGR
jgi:predicted transcriptional regulator of viral defense system